jgi:hypothetical protein
MPSCARVLYFSAADACRRPDVLRSVGFTVHECTAFAELAACLGAGENPDLVCVSDDGHGSAARALTLVRSLSTAPAVLFANGSEAVPESSWDLEVPALTHPGTWLSRIVELAKRVEEH